jgi:hypothetical protein
MVGYFLKRTGSVTGLDPRNGARANDPNAGQAPKIPSPLKRHLAISSPLATKAASPRRLNLKIENVSKIGCSVNRTPCACNAANFSEMSNIDQSVGNRTWQDPDHRTVRGVGLPPNEEGLPPMFETHATLCESSKILVEHPPCPKCTTRMMPARIMPGA